MVDGWLFVVVEQLIEVKCCTISCGNVVICDTMQHCLTDRECACMYVEKIDAALMFRACFVLLKGKANLNLLACSQADIAHKLPMA